MTLVTSLITWIAECLAHIGTVTHRPMMGGATLYLDGTVFAIIAQGQLWFKADNVSDATWDDEGRKRFTYTFPNGRVGSMNYRLAPDDVNDDADAMIRWSQLALEAGRRAPAKKPRKMKP